MNKADIGKKMFGGASTGAALGAVGGGIYGGIKAQQEVNTVPVDKVELRGYDKPVYESRPVAKEMHGIFQTTKTAEFPVRNTDGSLKMEHMPSRTVEGRGKPVFGEINHEIKEPYKAVQSHWLGNDEGFVNYNEFTSVKYDTVGTWTEPTVRFEHGVNVGGYILGYAAAGAVIGGIGGALVGLATSFFTGNEE